ncbi:ABC transporter substrate-binding protein [Chelatococcus reniformis]|uniref:Branched-chain amino acid ABC transporter substrate-binding protein n=1 Tax=Chelatococcus reniformis TaxID=1494448 RepID=A0A916U734_9HYPH|nr:ABC transporter substrate-binding protein [Chelatococcus reniformis]GGC61851.1 branched-chain amino acid ABC transporter substrate-binding protein [Chelatococcus reniformis]
MSMVGRLAAGVAVALLSAQAAQAQKSYGPGASDTEIKIGQTMPYSGPASAYGTQGRAEVAYFAMLNAQGGINGRKVNLISLDDAYSPPKTVEQTRKLVESDDVLALVNTIGTATNAAVQKYLNTKKVPQLLVSSGAARWNDPKAFPWTTPGVWSYPYEGRVYGRQVVKTNPNAKIAILSQNDDAGRDYVRGFKEGLGDAVKDVVKEATYEVTDPTIDSQILQLKSSGADTLFVMATPKFGAQAIRKVAELGWKPAFYISSVAASRAQTLAPAGLDNAKGLITATVLKEASDPNWDNDPGMLAYKKFMQEWYKDGDPLNSGNVFGYTIAQITAHILKSAGDDLTRENVLKQATNIQRLSVPLLLPGVTLNVSPTNYATYDTFRLQRFDGERWVVFGDPITVE